MPRRLPAAHRRWVILNALGVTAIINLVINGLIAWISVAGVDRVPLWAAPLVGGPSTITDTVGTLFLLPLITCLLVTTAVRRDLRLGRLPALTVRGNRKPRLWRLPRSRLRRGALFGALTVAALAPASLLVLVATDLGDLAPADFVLFKVLFAIGLGALVTPLIAISAMADGPSR